MLRYLPCRTPSGSRVKLTVAALVAAVVFACSVKPGGNTTETSGTQPGEQGLPGSGNGSSGGVGLGNATPDASGAQGGLVFGDGGNMRASANPPPPPGCDPTCAAAHGTCNGNVCTIAENPGGVDMATQGQLQNGGKADSGFAWLYPYDRTVFGRGLLSPTLQFDGAMADGAVVRITSMTLDYTGYFQFSQSPTTLSLPQPSWDAVVAAALPTDPVQVKVTKVASGKESGPIQEAWTFAKGYMRGTIYYETYNSQVAGGTGSVGIMQIRPGDSMPTALATGCGNVCHTASADGSTLVAATTLGGPNIFGLGGATSTAYDLTNNFATIRTAMDDSYTYAGLYPDGSIFMSATSFRAASGNPSRLFDTKTGAPIAAAGWDNTITNGGTVAFSPDGKQIAFIHEDMDQGHTLAKMDFDRSTNTFSNLVDLATDPNLYLAWPAFTPDGKQVLYHAGTNAAFETDCGASGDLYVVDVATKTVRRLDTIDGYTGSGTASYLPASDPDLNFAPTILSEPIGGYFWAIFTSHRSYGNLLASQANGTGGMAMCRNAAGDGANGKLWVAALDINGAPGQDISHPAFYLDGQELQADNLRGYWVLPPCRKDGEMCASGDMCCGGYCGMTDAGGLVCGKPPPGSCAKEYDKCMTTADCCDAKDQCIAGRCAQPTAQ
jgi:hypothetical protein